eukprot:5431681-Amphidinium_carterae.1
MMLLNPPPRNGRTPALQFLTQALGLRTARFASADRRVENSKTTCFEAYLENGTEMLHWLGSANFPP